jgi:hypothetical protein
VDSDRRFGYFDARAAGSVILDPGRTARRDVSGRVAWTCFREYPAGEADYLACRQSL